MISKEQADKILKGKKKANLKEQDFKIFSNPYLVLGQLLTNTLPKSKYRMPLVKVYQSVFGEDVHHNPWNTKEGVLLAEMLYGKLRAPYVSKIWEFTKTLPFQRGYNRRPFRIAASTSHLLLNLERLRMLYNTSIYGFSDCSFPEQVRLSGYYQNMSNGYMFAVVLQDGHQELLLTIQDIINGEDEVGAVSKDMIKALLLTDKQENWQLVEKLLLAAQRQEGLRQVILETLDETNIGALQYLIHTILEHNLTRFSSVVRAVDTWFGFGWDAPKKTTIKRVLELAITFLADNSAISAALKSKDNLEVYVALCVLALTNVSRANDEAFTILYKTDLKEKKLLALFFIYETKRTKHNLVPFMENAWGNDVALDYWCLINAPAFELKDEFFQKIKATADALPKDGKAFSGAVFEWKNYNITPYYFYDYLIRYANDEQLVILAENISKLPSNVRETFIRKIFPKHYTYSLSNRYYQGNQNKIPQLELEKGSWKRALIHQAIRDRNTSVMATGLQAFRYMNLVSEELGILEDLLARKGKDLRKYTIELLVQQPEEKVKTSTVNLIVSKKVEQRLAGLEILTVLEDEQRYPEFVTEQIHQYQQRKSFTKNEEVLLAKFSKQNQSEFSFANGFGVIDYDKLSALIEPKSRFEEKKSVLSFLKTAPGFRLKGLVDEAKTVKEINKLIDLMHTHRDYEYQYEGYQGEMVTVLFGNVVRYITKDYKNFTVMDHLNDLPLAEVWKGWYEASRLNDFELFYALFFVNAYGDPFERFGELTTFIKSYFPNMDALNIDKKGGYQSINAKIRIILSSIHRAYRDEQTILNFKIDVLEDMIAKCPKDLKSKNLNTNQYRNDTVYWSDLMLQSGFWLSNPEIDSLADHQVDLLKRYYDLNIYLFAQRLGFPEKIDTIKSVVNTKNSDRQINPPGIHLVLSLYKKNKLTEEDVLFQALYRPDLFRLLDGGINYNTKIYKEYNIPTTLMKSLKKNMLQVELERGDLPTEVSEYVSSFVQIEGVAYVFEVLERLGKENLERGYSYSRDSKKSNFSTIIRLSTPSETDTFEDFAKGVKEAKITKKRLMEVACYATQWAGWIGEYLKIESLENAVWWFHAHASEYMNAQKETVISRYSNIPKNDFSNGAIDIDWFNQVYAKLGKANWKILHEAAKYISFGNGHRQVKLYSSVMLGEVKITETLKKVNEKRDKDYLRALGLVPLSKRNPKKDLLSRYNLIQTFLKESKQFGSQRQESEKIASEIALDNLSRNAGYQDRIRFGWAMEGEATQKIMENDTVVFNDVTIKLMVNEQGKAEIKVLKGDKIQKTIPAKYKKDKGVQMLKEGKSFLSKQYARTRQSLENAMVREDPFGLEEIQNIMRHPVVKAMLGTLILYNKTHKIAGFYDIDGLRDTEGTLHTLAKDETVVIAHPSHLYEAVQWDVYQKYLFEHRIIQPFKQVFRELYVITENEREHSFRSERYQGHQIQPKKTIAVLRSRGWTVSRDEGLQKVYHSLGFMATMYAMADWFSPADVEAPTLEYVCFHSLKDYKPIPLEEIPSVVFSEVMRDVDLVVSVAHLGGVDPEASHSTMEMRAALAKESARLFKLDNIEVKERHILVKGALGEYSIHLGSANISKAGLHLSIIPVHSQHRGRMFLPFVDDDPKSAEIISKMKLLAEDHKIQDPTVLAQINS
ncbi:DUF4132 domain-containing protein [Aquimarina addita]|uniref:DUF4132 domain-containing protein n=1 Tax=Aquimarina addita TaxID=870485 RepID=A0ABP7XGE7_9FLAO